MGPAVGPRDDLDISRCLGRVSRWQQIAERGELRAERCHETASTTSVHHGPTSSVHPQALMESLEPLLEGELQEAFGSGVLMPLI